MPEPTISVVVVTYRQGEGVRPALEALSAQLRSDDELIVIDNASGDDTPTVVEQAAPAARLVPSASNDGFPAACNRGAALASGDLLVFLNPDAVPAPGWRDAIAAPLMDASGWAAWQALVTAEGGTTVNTRGGVVHFTGIAWAGGAGEPIGDESALSEPGFVSGACLAIRREEFERLGGFAGDFFLYHEDVDLSLRVRLAGGSLGVASGARVDHDYEFDKGPDEVAPPRAQPLGDADPHVSRARSSRCSRPRSSRPSWRSSWWQRQAAGYRRSSRPGETWAARWRAFEMNGARSRPKQRSEPESSRPRLRPPSARPTSARPAAPAFSTGYSRRTGGSSCACSESDARPEKPFGSPPRRERSSRSSCSRRATS